jgi:Subtilase family
MKHRVILQVHAGTGGARPKPLRAGADNAAVDVAEPLDAARAEPEASDVLSALVMDAEYAVRMPGVDEAASGLVKGIGAAPDSVALAGGHLVRGHVDAADLPAVLEASRRSSAVSVFSDPAIAPALICATSPALGTALDVAANLGVSTLQRLGMDGTGVRVAIVDTGFNIDFLRSRGVRASFDPQLSWTLPGGPAPGQQTVQHGSMTSFDSCIGAPNCTLLDYPVLGQPNGNPDTGLQLMTGILSDAILAYSQLLRIRMAEPQVPLVVNNSWGMFNPTWDWPIGTPGNYSDNPLHPFNIMVATLDRLGADLVFCSGDCGAACPDPRCGGVTNVIYGANSSRNVLCVSGVDNTGQWVGYSTQGPGLLENTKPDVAGFTHFYGSGTTPVDSGTSASAPVVTGLLAAVRTRVPPTGVAPSALRDAVRRTAIRPGPPAFDYELGWGIVNGPGLAVELSAGAWDQVAPVAAPAAEAGV